MSSGIALAVGSLLAATDQLDWLSTARARSEDWLLRASEPVRARSTTIVGIDPPSYRALLPVHGTMNEWPRTLYARAIERLREAGARVVVLDVLFDAPGDGDRELAAAMTEAGNVLLPVAAQGQGPRRPAPGVAQAFDDFYRSTEEIARAAAGEGVVNLTTDPDSVVRGLPLLLQSGPERLPSLALTAVAAFVRRPAVIDAPATDETIFSAGRAIPVGATGSLRIRYLGPPSRGSGGGPFQTLSFVDVLEGSFDRALVEDRLVLVGLTVLGLDEYATPTTGDVRMWGVEVLGHAIETILSDRYLAPASTPTILALTLGLALAAGALVGACRPLVATAGALVLLGSYLLLAGIAVDQGVLIDPLHPSSALVLAFATTAVYRIVFERAEQRQVRDVMGRYLSPDVGRWVLEEPDRLKLGGETREMTVLFSDLRGFTALSHRLAPQELVALLNEYMTAMTRVVFAHNGVLDKFIGDAIMAFWNAPIDQPDHARRACDAALDMVATLEDLRASWQRRGMPLLDLGIGISTGEMIVGNMGSLERLAYTVLGDSVNVASRLEGLSKLYGTRVIVGEGTRAAAGPAFEYRDLDVVAVRNRAEPLAVAELSGRAGGLSPTARALQERYTEGLELYREQRWKDAAALFDHLHAQHPEDGPTALYLRRCLELAASPPDDWDGVHRAR